MEEDLELRLSDDVVARAIKEIFEEHQISIKIVAKGDPNLESYVVASEDVDSLHPEFVDWFEDKSSTKKYYECRGLPHAAKRAASLINEWTPKIIQHYKDNLHGHQYTVFARKIAQHQFAKSQNGSPAPSEYSMIWKMGFYCIREGLKPDLRKFWLIELVKHQMSSQRKKFKVDEYARKQIQIWYETVLSLLEDGPTPAEDSELADDPIPEAYRIIKDISIYGGASSKARIVEALKTLQGAKETKQFTQARKGMSLSGPVRPMHQDTYAYLKNNVGKSFIDIPSALYIARDTWSETMIVRQDRKFWIPGSFIVYAPGPMPLHLGMDPGSNPGTSATNLESVPRSVESEQLIELQVDNCGFSHRIFQVRHIYLLYILNTTPWVPAAG